MMTTEQHEAPTISEAPAPQVETTRYQIVLDALRALPEGAARIDVHFGVDNDAVNFLLSIDGARLTTHVYEGYGAAPPYAIDSVKLVLTKGCTIGAQRDSRWPSTPELRALDSAKEHAPTKSTTMPGGDQ